jgi:hypothetical protein
MGIQMQTAEQNKPELIYADSREAINALVLELIEEAQREYTVDRRRERRHPLAMLINVVPIGENGRLVASGFAAVTRDISARGISFLHTGPVEEKYLFLRFPQASFDPQALVMEVLRRTEIGPFWIIAGKFIPHFE